MKADKELEEPQRKEDARSFGEHKRLMAVKQSTDSNTKNASTPASYSSNYPLEALQRQMSIASSSDQRNEGCTPEDYTAYVYVHLKQSLSRP